MDYRKDMRTPRDRVDDEMLSRLLRETDELIAGCGCEETRSGSAKRAERRTNLARNTNGSCGCGRNNGDGRNEPSPSACGCGNQRSREGCSENTNGSCGCGECRDNSRRYSGEQGTLRNCINPHSVSVQTQGLPLVMSYAPDHEFCDLYEDEEALETGTAFRKLNFPFYGVRCNNCGKKTDKNCGCED